MQWLLENRIDFVLWLKSEAKVPAGTFERSMSKSGRPFIGRSITVQATSESASGPGASALNSCADRA